MASPFSRTLRSVREDGARRSRSALAAGLLLLAAWTCWLFFSRLPVYVTSTEARLEIDRAAHPIQAPLAGRVTRVAMQLGLDVRAGDALVELDIEPQRLELAQGLARIHALEPELEAARRQLASEEEATAALRGGAKISVAEAYARVREADAARKEANEQLDRTTRLASEGLVSKGEAGHARSEREQRSAASDALRLAAGRIAATKRLDASDRVVQARALERQIAALEGEIGTVRATVERLQHEVDRRVVRAPVDGQLAEMAPITIGAMVREGDRLAMVLPAGHLRAVAVVAPQDALGRVRVGQPARVRLEGFPWGQHGTIAATVTRVAGEVRDNRVRIELSVDASSSRIPLQHGLPGLVEIEVERTSPAALMMRAAGRRLERPAPAPAAGEHGAAAAGGGAS